MNTRQVELDVLIAMGFMLLIVLLLLSLIIYSQNRNSSVLSTLETQTKIEWEKSMNWTDVLAKARKHGKLIFVDCVASWCVPCKKMDSLVYIQKEVVEFVTNNFIPIKVQMDSSTVDNVIGLNYEFGEKLQKTYNITSLPTFLIFNSDGLALHKDVGYKSVKLLIEMLTAGMDQSKQYYTAIADFARYNLVEKQLYELAVKAKQLNDTVIVKKVARYYFNTILPKQSLPSIATSSNLKFVKEFSYYLTSEDTLFKVYERNTTYIDSAARFSGYSKSILNKVIQKDFVIPFVNKSKLDPQSPQWERLYAQLKKRFNAKMAQKHLIDAKVLWYQFKKNKAQYTRYLVLQAKLSIQDSLLKVSGFTLNNWAWDIFCLSSKTEELTFGLQLIDMALLELPNDLSYLDTKANLLYKLGHKEKAIRIMKEVVSRAEVNHPTFQISKKALEKMELGMPTWLKEWHP